MISNHFYTRYGLALLYESTGVINIEGITSEMLKKEIQIGLDHFRLRPNKIEADGKVTYDFANENFLLKNPKYIKKHWDEGFYLSPNIITKDLQASNSWNTLQNMKEELDKNDLKKSTDATMAKIPITSKFNNGKRSQSVPKASLLEVCLCLIVTTTPYKPCLLARDKGIYLSHAIIPDLEIGKLKKFISLFNEMQRNQTENIMQGKVEEQDGKQKYWRPNLSNGNFPHAPRRSELASAALLGAIGKFAKETEYPNTDAEEVLEELKNNPLYIVSYGKAQSVSYTHYIVELAKENKLCDIVDALGKFMPYISDRKNFKNKQQKMDNFFLFASRFLQLFDKQSFSEFLSVRGEYPKQLTILLKTFFRNVMKINDEVIDSAIALGHWLNQTAYFAAAKENKGKSYQEIADAKAKIIVELESAVFSAKTPSALVSQVVTRAGRISKRDAPNESQLFIKKIIAGELGETEKASLENAKNMLAAFSRIKGVKTEAVIEDELLESEKVDEDLIENNN
ncbi:MAG: hypothetical protein K8F36_07860 [Melioribacteraceae bacterium]|nr:hypothetical protein [Melioribacteraceae bacterium]